MIIDKENIESIFNYTNKTGERFWTPNGLLAHARAEQLGTNKVYVETYAVPPLPEKPKKDLTD